MNNNKEIDEFTAVFWDGMHEGIFTIDNFEEWMDKAGAKGPSVHWRLSLAKHFPPKIWGWNYNHERREFINDPDILWRGMYNQISGNACIQSNNVTNLDFMASITHIMKSISIVDSPIGNLSGINNLKHCCGNLSIMGLNDLKNINGINSLKYIGGSLTIILCNKLETIEGFDSLKNVKGNLDIRKNDQLTKINTFSSIEEIGCLVTEHNTKLPAHLCSRYLTFQKE